MNTNHTSDSYRKSILRYSITGIVCAGIIIAFIIAVPFSVRLQKEQNSHLAHQVQVKAMIIEEFLSRATDTAFQITSRTQIRTKLEAYNRKEIDLVTLNTYSEPKLADAMRLSEDIAGLVRLDKTNNLTAQAGQSVPEELWSVPGESSQEILINGPVNINNVSFIVLAAPILGQNQQRAGTDIILYKTDRLRQIVQDYRGLGETGETILGKINKGKINLFYPLRTQTAKSSLVLSDNTANKQALLAAAKHHDELYRDDNPQGLDAVIAYEPIRDGLWCLFVKMDKYELYDSVYKLIIVTGVTVVFFILLGASGMHRVLRPMVGKILIHTDDLEAKIKEQTTELQEACNQLKRMQSELNQKHKMEAIGTMAGGIAHNFNNNLAVILGNLELAELNKNQPVKIERYLDNAKIAVMRSRDLISQISTYSRKGNPTLVPLKLHQILDETVKLLRSTLPSTITMTQTVRVDSDHVIFAEASRIQEVLFNLCNNAVQAMDEKGHLSLSLESADLKQQDILSRYSCQPGHYLRLSVQDNGCGITDEVLEKIFDPFFTTKEVHKGTGMGLSTVQGIMQKVNGMITVESTVGQGSTFTLYFPVVKHGLERPAGVDSHVAPEISRPRLAQQ